MTLHLVKLSVGAQSVKDLQGWVKRRVAANAAAGRGRVSEHVTRMFPRRKDALLDGGSLYWVVKGVVCVRQKIVALETATGEDGIERCSILLDPALIETEAQPRRAFQGWRYLKPEDAPRDLSRDGAGNASPSPGVAALHVELAELGLL